MNFLRGAQISYWDGFLVHLLNPDSKTFGETIAKQLKLIEQI
jgi:hypothetical protein